MKLIQKLFILSSVALAVSCGGGSKSLVVGTNAEFPPFEYLEGSEIVGFDIDLIKAVAEQMGTNITIENLSWDGLLPALQSKKIDLIISGMTVTPDRQAIVNFSDPYYIAEEQMMIVQNSNTNITTMDDLIGKKVGVVLGYTGDVIVSDMEGVNVERYNSPYQAVMDVQNGKIDALVVDNQPAKNYAANNTNVKAVPGNNTEEAYAIAIPKDNMKLLGDVNAALLTIQADGTYQKIYNKYFPENAANSSTNN